MHSSDSYFQLYLAKIVRAISMKVFTISQYWLHFLRTELIWLNSQFAEGIASEDNKEALLVSASTLLLPLLLPRVYPPLFTLYALYNEKEDNLYWDRLQKWNRQSDLALMNFLGVDPKFYDEEKNGSHFSGRFSIVFLSTDLLKKKYLWF